MWTSLTGFKQYPVTLASIWHHYYSEYYMSYERKLHKQRAKTLRYDNDATASEGSPNQFKRSERHHETEDVGFKINTIDEITRYKHVSCWRGLSISLLIAKFMSRIMCNVVALVV